MASGSKFQSQVLQGLQCHAKLIKTVIQHDDDDDDDDDEAPT